MQHLHLLLVNSEPCKILQRILDQRDDFLRTLSDMNEEDQCVFLKKVLINNKLLVPVNSKLPMVFIFSDDVTAIITINHPTKKVFDFMLNKLLSCLFVQCCNYEYYKKQELVFVFTFDKRKLPTAVKNKLYRDRDLEKLLLLKHNNSF